MAPTVPQVLNTIVFYSLFSLNISIKSLFFCFVLFSALDPDLSPDEVEEKERLIAQVLELQNTLDGES